jgi:hypothetical protein
MKLFVQARKDGYNVLYPKPTPSEFFQFAGDIRPDSKDPNLLGKYIYTISFANGGCIFTKHVIVQDVQRQGLGNIGFSIFIPNNKKLSGNDSIKLLDELLNTYSKNYCPDYYLENKTEDWEIFEAIKNQYKLYDLSNDDTEDFQRGTADAAFVYYIDEIELCKFFDNPYQEEYSTYKQVFFVVKNLEGKSDNPLNAIPHDPNANLTGKIDLENPKYKLIYNQQAKRGVKIEVKVNGSLRYSKIKRKEDLQIIWSKQFCETKIKNGKWHEIGSDFLEINDIEKTITVKEIEIHPITYTLLIQTKDRFSSPITGAEIRVKINNYLPERKAINNSIQITEEELQNKCYIIAQKDNLISPQREIKLEDTKGSITLILSEHKKVSFYVKDENGLINNYNIQISNKEVQPKEGNVVFIGEEIEETWQISVSHRDYETERFPYCPAKDVNPKYITLKKKIFSGQGQSPNRKKYYIKIDEKKGKRSYKGRIIKEYENQPPIKEYGCDAKYGYRFIEWKMVTSEYSDSCESYEAIFKKLWYRKVPTVAWAIIFMTLFIPTIFLLVDTPSPPKGNYHSNSHQYNKIDAYLDGIELNLDTLKHYKSICCDSNTGLLTQDEVQEKSWWQKLWIFGSDDTEDFTNQNVKLSDLCSKIDNTIALRRAINNGKIDELKVKTFSKNQNDFQNAINIIESDYQKQIGDTLKALKVSVMNLNEIADLILSTQSDLKKKETGGDSGSSVGSSGTNGGSGGTSDASAGGSSSGTSVGGGSSGTSVTVSSGGTQQLNNSSLEDEFWRLVNSGNTQEYEYNNLWKKHKNKGGDIIAYLSKIRNPASFKKFKDIPEMDRKSAKTLTEIDIN